MLSAFLNLIAWTWLVRAVMAQLDGWPRSLSPSFLPGEMIRAAQKASTWLAALMDQGLGNVAKLCPQTYPQISWTSPTSKPKRKSLTLLASRPVTLFWTDISHAVPAIALNTTWKGNAYEI